jgi:hypothetical protein
MRPVTDEQRDEPQAPSPETTLRYRGELLRLAAIEPDADAEVFAAWFDDQ